jgi:NNP family nitrate/nitrite transporter-like MFS transporter
VFCLLMGLTSKSLGATMAILVIFSIFCQQSCGLSFGIVPFVSKRSTGLVSGFVGSGGNVGGAVTQVGFEAVRLATACK